jgi:hypothetical protein
MKRILSFFTLLVLLSGTARAQITFDNIPPLSGGGNTAGGVSFNFTTNQSITIQNLRAAFSTATGTANVWYNPQKINGAPNISTTNGWVNLGSATFAGLSPASTSPVAQTIPVNLNLTMQPQDTFGFFIQWTGNVYPTTNTNIPTFTNGTVTIIADAKSAFAGTGTTPTYNPRQINGGVIYTLNTPCTAPPTAGTTNASVTAICPNTNFQLSLTGATVGTGLTYQWQSSANGTTWNNITGATARTLTTTQLTTTHYRVQVTCSGQTANSTPVQVTTSATPTSGTFTINKNAAPSVSNFISFAAAVASIECGGVNGPVIFNVVTGTGPYNESVTIPAIPGASATNTITFNGNGNKIAFASTAADRSVIRLDGADYIRINNLEIEASDATYGWGIHFLNGADNNIISNNTITIASTNTTESNSSGIVFSNSTTVVTSAGNTGNTNQITGNTIIGGFKGIHLNGVITGTGNNQLTNNIIKDFYSYGIEVGAAKGTLVEGNDISRPARTANGIFYGVYVSGGSVLTLVSKNRIHNSDGGDLTPTTAFYGLYITATDAPAGQENIFKNNLIYDVNNTGGIYGIYNSGSDGAFYYHNTVNLENPLNNAKDFGFYQITAGTNIKFINNIIKMNLGTGGLKYLIYFSTTTSTIVSNNNVLYFPATLTNHHTGYFSANKTTLADWKTANSNAYDQNSIFADPQFMNAAAGNLRPINPAVGNVGQGVPAVTDDIIGTLRNTVTPDPGAYESIPVANDLALTTISGPASSCGLTNQETLALTVINYGTASQSNIQVSYQINSNPVVTETLANPLASFATATHTFATKANLSASGNYTIVYSVALAGDANMANNTDTLHVTNSLIPALPVTFDFETATTGLGRFRTLVNTKSRIMEDSAASFGTTSYKGMLMDGIANAGFITPGGTSNPWTMNPDNFAAAKICITPGTGATTDSLIMTLDLKQLFKTANGNTNFRVTVNGNQVGPTHRPPFDPTNPATPIAWKQVKVNLTPYINLASIEVSLESSVKEEFANGTGPANLVDNINIFRKSGPTGLKENALASQLNVFPNPSNGLFHVNLPSGKTYSLEVSDLTCKTILKQTATGNAHLKLENTAKGIYLLKVTGEGSIATKKLVIE